MSASNEIVNAFMTFVESCPEDKYDFPMGGDLRVPLPSEIALLEALKKSSPIESWDVASLRQGLDMRQAYSLVIFVVRMAVYGARTASADLLSTSLVGLVIDDEILDWRDTLSALSIVEDCASRLGLDFRGEIDRVIHLATNSRRRTILDGYLSRSSEMRAVRVFGYTATQGSDGLQYSGRC